MENLYYKIWVDGIVKAKSIPANKGSWKFYTMVFISFAMALNILLFMAILQRNILHNYFYELRINISSSKKLNEFLEFFILYLLLPLCINYFFIFKNDRYKVLITKYKSHNGKLLTAYLLTSYFLPIILLLIGYVILKIK